MKKILLMLVASLGFLSISGNYVKAEEKVVEEETILEFDLENREEQVIFREDENGEVIKYTISEELDLPVAIPRDFVWVGPNRTFSRRLSVEHVGVTVYATISGVANPYNSRITGITNVIGSSLTSTINGSGSFFINSTRGRAWVTFSINGWATLYKYMDVRINSTSTGHSKLTFTVGTGDPWAY